eukprot:4964963-Pyramimonas_sp.AAC.1
MLLVTDEVSALGKKALRLLEDVGAQFVVRKEAATAEEPTSSAAGAIEDMKVDPAKGAVPPEPPFEVPTPNPNPNPNPGGA